MTCDEVWLVRHGETEWSRDGRHTSTTDLPLTDDGRAGGRRRCATGSTTTPFALVLTSPRLAGPRRRRGWPATPRRRSTTTSPSGTTATSRARPPTEIRETYPDWTIWTGPVPGGETAEQVSARLDRVVARCRAADGRVLVFGHGHSLRALAARWLDLPVADGRHLRLDTATVSVLGYERETPVVQRWNC